MRDLNVFQRFFLAIRCFFLVVFARRLPEDAVALVPAGLVPKELPEKEPQKALPPPAPVVESAKPAEPQRPAVDETKLAERGAVRLLALLQREGRLVDFLQENIDTYEDAQIGAAVRDIHRGCKKVLAEYVTLAPVRGEPEESTVKVEPGFDASSVRLVGDVVGQPPFTGTLRHPGWRARAVKLPAMPDGYDATIVAPAEVEIGGGAGY